MPIAIITDSTSDLPQELIDKHNIYVVPLYVLWGTDQYKDGEDITPAEFYQRLPEDPNHPSTSQPTPNDFKSVLAQAKADGADEAVIVTISSALSGTYSSANQASNLVDFPVHVVDSKSASLGVGLMVMAGVKARDEGKDAEGIVKAIEDTRAKMKVLLYVDTLDYLHKGGRIGGAQKLLGTALNLKPQLYVDHEKGTVEPGARTRTKKKALSVLYKTFFESIDADKKVYVGVTSGDSQDDADAFIKRIREKYDNVELITAQTSPVIGVHTGPGAIAVCGYVE